MVLGLREPELLIRNCCELDTAGETCRHQDRRLRRRRRRNPGASATMSPHARHTAMSALNNDRFRVMLEQITDPGASGALMTMRSDGGSAGTDFKSAQSSYADNSE